MFFTQLQHLDVGIQYNGLGNNTGGNKTCGEEQPFNLLLRATNATSTIVSNSSLPHSWHAAPNDVVRFTIAAVNVTHYRFSAAPTNNLNEVMVLGDLPASLISSAWGNSAGAGTGALVEVYATANGERKGNVMVEANGRDNNAYLGRWRYQGRGQEVEVGTFV